MAIFTSRRFEHRRANRATRQIIMFQLQQEWFALPIELVHRVVPLGPVYGMPQGLGMSLTRYENREIPVIDIKRRVFVETSETRALPPASDAIAPNELEPYIPVSIPSDADQADLMKQDSPRYLLIVQDPQNDLLGIPIESQPSLKRVPESAFAQPPASYLAKGNVRCVSALVALDANQPSLFLLDLQQLIQDVPMLSGYQG
ncbi:MAG TPA: chemotaxis protein CheW [Crinalium sp.]|jgi:purine-binding chemotaxis protein CheW